MNGLLVGDLMNKGKFSDLGVRRAVDGRDRNGRIREGDAWGGGII